jgi:transcriptional regulator with XRE-family HTH domain
MTPDELRARLDRLGMSQSEAARRLGVTHAALWRWLNGGKIAHPKMLDLALQTLEREQTRPPARRS